MRGGTPYGGLIEKNESSLGVGEQDGRDWGEGRDETQDDFRVDNDLTQPQQNMPVLSKLTISIQKQTVWIVLTVA